MISLNTSLCKLLNIEYPIIQAGMAGGSTTVEMIVNVCNSGALGTLGAAYMSPEEIRKAIQAIKKQTSHPFAVNIFSANDKVKPNENKKEVEAALLKIGKNLGIEAESITMDAPDLSEERFQVLLDEEVPIISTAFGILPANKMKVVKEKDIKIIAMVTTVNEAISAEKAGVDVIVVQGSDAGGHRSTFDIERHPNGANIGTFSLVPQVVENVNIPVVAAGGVMNGKGLVAALALGAEGVQMGTRFLGTTEADIHPLYKKAIFESTEEDTVLTKSFSGRPARGIKNKFIEEFDEMDISPLAFPMQNTATRNIRNEAHKQNKVDYMSLWAGQGLRTMKKETTVAVIIKEVLKEAKNIIY